MGAKGLETRRRLITATEGLLNTKPLRELRVADIAKAAKTSSSTFYLYFQDVPEAVLAVIGQFTQSTPEFLTLLSEPWPEAEAHGRAQKFVETYIDFFNAHGAVFRVRNLAADEGDERFLAVQVTSVTPLMEAVATRIEARRAAGALPATLDPLSTAAVLLAMIERVAAIPPATPAWRGIARDQTVDAAVFFAAVVLGGSSL